MGATAPNPSNQVVASIPPISATGTDRLRTTDFDKPDDWSQVGLFSEDVADGVSRDVCDGGLAFSASQQPSSWLVHRQLLEGDFDIELTFQLTERGDPRFPCRLNVGLVSRRGEEVLKRMIPDASSTDTTLPIEIHRRGAVVTERMEGRQFTHSHAEALYFRFNMTSFTEVRLLRGTMRFVEKAAKQPSKVRELKFPARISRVCLGGGGRYLVMPIPDRGEIAILDLQDGKWLSPIAPLRSEEFVAAGLECVIVADRGPPATLRRHRFSGEQLSKTLKDVRIEAISLGSAATKPLLVVTSSGDKPTAGLFDPETLEPSGEVLQVPSNASIEWSGVTDIRASANGQVFGLEDGRSFHAPFCYSHNVPRVPRPLNLFLHFLDGDGTEIFAGQSHAMQNLNDHPQQPKRWVIPSQESGWFFELVKSGYLPEVDGSTEHDVVVRRYETKRPLFTIANSGLTLQRKHFQAGAEISAEKRVWMLPKLDVLAILPSSNDRVLLHPIDRLVPTQPDLVWFNDDSRLPDALAKVPYEYSLHPRPGASDCRLTIKSEVSGLTIDNAGRIEWKSPAAPQTLSLPHKIEVKAIRNEATVAQRTFLLDVRSGVSAKSEWMVNHLSLKGPIGDLALGAGGRLVAAYVPSEKALVIIDVETGKIAREIALESGNIRFAVGRQDVVVFDLETSELKRWDLATFEQVATEKVTGEDVHNIHLGCDSVGPLMLVQNDKPTFSARFRTLRTLKPLLLGVDGGSPDEKLSAGYDVRVSADGRVFGCWNGRMKPAFLRVIEVRTGKVVFSKLRENCEYILPDERGELLYTAFGRYFNSLEKYDAVGGVYPAAHGELGLFAHGAGQLGCLHSAQPNRIFELPFELSVSRNCPKGATPLPPDKMLFLVPMLDRLLEVDEQQQGLNFWRFEPARFFAKAEASFLWVLSKPPATLKRGTAYRYQIRAVSNRGKCSFELELGPRGMQVSADGLVTWDADAFEHPQEVVVAISDASGARTLHSFSISASDDP